jgi:hypothetical protein
MLAGNMIYSDGQALTTTADSTNVLDAGPGKDAFGVAKVGDVSDLWLHIRVKVTLAGGTNVAFKLQDSADNSSFSDVANVAVAAIAAATLVAGYKVLAIRMPRGVRRYTKIVYTISGTFTSGNVDAYLSESAEQTS